METSLSRRRLLSNALLGIPGEFPGSELVDFLREADERSILFPRIDLSRLNGDQTYNEFLRNYEDLERFVKTNLPRCAVACMSQQSVWRTG